MYLGDNLHKKIDLLEYTVVDNTNLRSSLEELKEYLFQNLAIDNATPISYTRFRMTTDENGNEIKESLMGHNVVVMHSNIFNDVIIIDTQQNKMNEFISYFLNEEPNVYKIYLYLQSDLPDTAMDVLSDPLKFTTDGGKRNKKSKKSKKGRKSRKSKKSNKTKRRKMKRKN